MHTFTLAKAASVYDEPEVVKQFFDLLQYAEKDTPNGIKVNCVPLQCDLNGEPWSFYCEMFVDALKLLQKENTTAESCETIKAICNEVLAHGGFTVDDFTVSRVDYCCNVCVPEEANRKCLFNLLKKCPTQVLYTSRDVEYPTSLYSKNKSKVINIYDKTAERRTRFKYTNDPDTLPKFYEQDMIRCEVQVKIEHLRYRAKKKGIPRIYDAWVNPQREQEYLAKLHAVIPAGDFCTLEAAKNNIECAGFSKRIKDNLKSFVQLIADADMDAAKDRYCYNTYQKYCNLMASINTNPITIPASFGIKRIQSPFHF